MGIINKIENTLFVKMKDGTKPKRKIMLYGFFGHNVGDDIFFDILLKRYPDTLFYVFFNDDYKDFFEKYNNARFYSYTRQMVAKVNAYGNKHGNEMLFEEILLKICDASVHIGGSVYQQIGDFKKDLEVRATRSKFSGGFFGISNNFGPYYTEDYKEFWAKQFKKWNGVCFRDKYSYELFSDIKNTAYAPDIIFGFKPQKEYKTEKSVAVSVVNTRIRTNDFSKEQSDNYINKIVNASKRFIDDGYEIKLLGFCAFEGDDKTVNEIFDKIPADKQNKVSKIIYTDNMEEIIDSIGKSEYVISTRFHASVLGFVFGKKVLPVCYSDKTINMLKDIEYTNYVKLSEAGDISDDEFYSLFNTLKPIELKSLPEDSEKQFYFLDKYISKKNGKIVR